MSRSINAVFYVLAVCFAAIAALCLILMFFLVNFEIVLRSFFDTSTLIADEYSGYLFSWLVLLGLLPAAREGRMLRVEFGLAAMSQRGRKFAGIFASLIGFVVSVIFGHSGYLLATTSYRFHSVNELSHTPVWIGQSVMPLAFAVLAIYYLYEAVSQAHDLIDSENP